jgi:hypothetical protein
MNWLRIIAKSKHKPRLFLLLFALFGVLILFYINIHINSKVNMDGFDQIQAGMTKDDVNLLLGVSPGIYASEPVEAFSGRVLAHRDDHELLQWVTDDCILGITFDVQGVVVRKESVPVRRMGRSSWLRRLLFKDHQVTVKGGI